MAYKILLGHDEAVVKWVCSVAGGEGSPRDVGIGLLDTVTFELVAGVIFNQYNRASIQMHVAGKPGARWMTKSYLGFCFQYAFHQAKVNKIIGVVGEANQAARRFDEHIGFELEATLPQAHPDGDLLIYSMTAAQCRWLNIEIPKDAIYGQV